MINITKPDELFYDAIDKPISCPYCSGENLNPFARFRKGAEIAKKDLRMTINCNHCEHKIEVIQIVEIRWKVDYL